jgi:hypothetical protein
MSALFFRVSWPQNIEKYRELQKLAKRHGRRLTVKNTSRMRGIPIFLFFLSRPENPDLPLSFSSLSQVSDALAKLGEAA